MHGRQLGLDGRRRDPRDGKLARGHLRPGKGRLAGRGAGQCGNPVGRAGVQQAVLGQRARRDDAGDLAPDHGFRSATRLGFLGVLGLLAHRHLEPGLDQAGQIGLGRGRRNPAHGDGLTLVLAAFCQGDVKSSRSPHGIIEEQLVEIPHAIEQQGIARGLGPQVEELLHHGRCPFRRGEGAVSRNRERSQGVHVARRWRGFVLRARVGSG